jgi:hypothetical protein
MNYLGRCASWANLGEREKWGRWFKCNLTIPPRLNHPALIPRLVRRSAYRQEAHWRQVSETGVKHD